MSSSRLTVAGARVGVQQASQACNPNVRLVRAVRYQVHGLKLLAKDDGEGALVWIHARDFLAAESFRCLPLPDLFDR